jgi:hypothetical protein
MKYVIVCVLTFLTVSCQEIVNTPPTTYQMSQNFPNPFTDTTAVYYGIPFVGSNSTGPTVRLVVNDRFNHTVATLVDIHNHYAGSNIKAVWNGRGSNYQKTPAGIYYIELQQLNSPSYGDVIVHVRRAALKQ